MKKKIKIDRIIGIIAMIIGVFLLAIWLGLSIRAKNEKTELENKIIGAVKQEYVVVGYYDVQELTEFEWEENTQCYVVVNQNRFYYVAVSGEGIDVDDNWETFCWLHKQDKEVE